MGLRDRVLAYDMPMGKASFLSRHLRVGNANEARDEVRKDETLFKEKDEVVTAFDRQTGEQVWQVRWPGAMKVPFFAASNGSWIRATPAFDGERLYVAGMRDVLIHHYFGVKLEAVWEVVASDLPMLRSVVETILDEDTPSAD